MHLQQTGLDIELYIQNNTNCLRAKPTNLATIEHEDQVLVLDSARPSVGTVLATKFD